MGVVGGRSQFWVIKSEAEVEVVGQAELRDMDMLERDLIGLIQFW